MFLKPAAINSNNNLVAPTGFEPVFAVRHALSQSDRWVARCCLNTSHPGIQIRLGFQAPSGCRREVQHLIRAHEPRSRDSRLRVPVGEDTGSRPSPTAIFSLVAIEQIRDEPMLTLPWKRRRSTDLRGIESPRNGRSPSHQLWWGSAESLQRNGRWPQLLGTS